MDDQADLPLPAAEAWQCAFAVRIPFPVRSKANFRRYRRNRVADRARWSAHRAFEQDLSALVQASVPQAWQVGEADQPLGRRPVVVAVVYAATTLDASNLAKSVLDACQGLLYVNDASVLAVCSVARRTRRDQDGVVAFAQLPAGSSPSVTAQACARLTDTVAAGLP